MNKKSVLYVMVTGLFLLFIPNFISCASKSKTNDLSVVNKNENISRTTYNITWYDRVIKPDMERIYIDDIESDNDKNKDNNVNEDNIENKDNIEK